MSEEIGKIFLEFPTSSVSATTMRKNMVVLEDHRDLLLRIDYPPQTKFRLYSPEKAFFDPATKQELNEYIFSSGQESYLWLSKFHNSDLLLERLGENGWEPHGALTPSLFDQADYSHEHARPAPIVFKVGPTDVALGSKLPEHTANGKTPDEYKKELARREDDDGPDARELMRKWEISKTLPRMTYAEGMRACHASPLAPEEPHVDLMVEILPTTSLYGYATHDGSGLIGTESDASLAVNAIESLLGTAVDKGRLAKYLRHVPFRITQQTLQSGQVKKYIVFKGFSGTRNLVTASRYAVDNVRIIMVSANNLTMSQLGKAGLGKMAHLGGVSAIIAVALETALWMAEGGKEVERLLAKASLSVMTCMITASLEPFIAAGVGALFKAAVTYGSLAPVAAGTIVIAVGAAVVVVGFVIGLALAYTPLEGWLYDIYKRFSDAWKADLTRISYEPIWEHQD